MSAKVNFEQARDYINQLDLAYIVQTMCADHYPFPRWTIADAKQCCQLYKNFLILMKKHYPQNLVPSRDIDEFWHNHILYTRNYFQDCLNIFGHYLHHEPASPLDNPEQLAQDYLKTKQYYLEEFKQALTVFIFPSPISGRG